MSNFKKGFTLIELMIVISVIGILSMVLVPKIGAIKIVSKNNQLEANIYLVQSYLQSRSDKDSNSIQTYVADHTNDLNGALSEVLSNINSTKATDFKGSSEIKNPFNSSVNVVINDFTTNSSIVFQSSSSTTVPTSSADIINNNVIYPTSSSLKGNVIVTIFNDRYTVYGIDSDGKKVSPIIIKMQHGVAHSDINTPSNTVSPLYDNITKLSDYLQSRVYYDIFYSNGNPQSMENMLHSGVTNTSIKSLTSTFNNTIINSLFSTWTSIGNFSTNTSPYPFQSGYSVIFYQGSNGKDIDFSNYKGTVIIYANSDAKSYEIYGINETGNIIGRRTISLVNIDISNALNNNLQLIETYLTSRINYDATLGSVGNIERSLINSSLSNNILTTFSNTNSIINPLFTSCSTINYYNVYPICSVIINMSQNGSTTDYSKYLGSVVIYVNSDAKSYTIYGISQNGSKYGERTISATNITTPLYDNLNIVSNILNSTTAQDLMSLNDKSVNKISTLKNLLSSQITNPLYSGCTTVGTVTNGVISPSAPYAIILCSNLNPIINFSSYTGAIFIYIDFTGNGTGNGNSDIDYYKIWGVNSDGAKYGEITIK